MEEERFELVPLKNDGAATPEVSCENCKKNCPMAGLKEGSAEWDAKMEVLILASLLPML